MLKERSNGCPLCHTILNGSYINIKYVMKYFLHLLDLSEKEKDSIHTFPRKDVKRSSLAFGISQPVSSN